MSNYDKYGILCPKCNFNRSEVIDSRHTSYGIRRRRRCANNKCKNKFSTVEMLDIQEQPDTSIVFDILEDISKLAARGIHRLGAKKWHNVKRD